MDILLNRREFIKRLGILSSSTIIASFLSGIGIKPIFSQASSVSNLFISKNGTPVTNMQKVIDMAGGITNFIDQNDVVILKPNLQWPKQGYTHTLGTKALIDIILNRPGGFAGEIIVAENVQAQDVDDTTLCGWAVSEGSQRKNNWADMNYNELITWYNNNGYPNVRAAKMDAPLSSWPYISGPSEGQGYVLNDYTISNSPGANGMVSHLSYPIIQSAYSGKLIDTSRNGGVWQMGAYTGEKAKLIFLPTLNYHSQYAGVTSSVKCHIGFSKDSNTWHSAYNIGVPMAVGEAVGHLITRMIQPTLYITIAEYSGWAGRTSDTAEQTKTIGLCADPVSLDYWMGKNVIGPCNGGSNASFLDPSNDNCFRKTLEGCQAKGLGTLIENEMSVILYDFNNPATTRFDIEKKIKQFKEGTATESEVKQLIDNYMKGQ